MFNKPFMFQITSAAPFSKEIQQKPEKGIKVTGVHMTDEHSFLGDIALSENAQKKLTEFLQNFSSLPIEGGVALKFSKRKNLELKFGKTSQAVDVKQIIVRKGKSHAFDVKITMDLLNIKSMTAAHIYDTFKEVEEISVVQLQEELPLKTASDVFKTSSKKNSRRIPENSAIEK